MQVPKLAWYGAGALLLAGLVLGLFVLPRPSRAVVSLVSPAFAPDEKAVPSATVSALARFPMARLVSSAEHKGLTITPPQQLPITAPVLRQAGKPEVLYLCNEYDGYCADASWPLALALAKFGTFHKLGYAVSLGSHNPATPGLDFYMASYSSKYITFRGVEMYTTRLLSAGTWQVLQQLTTAESNLLANWDIPPYAPTAGVLPFIDFGGPYYLAGPSFAGQGLEAPGQGVSAALKATQAAVLGSSSLSWAVQDEAAHMVGSICKLVHNSAPACAELPKTLEDIAVPKGFNQETSGPKKR